MRWQNSYHAHDPLSNLASMDSIMQWTFYVTIMCFAQD